MRNEPGMSNLFYFINGTAKDATGIVGCCFSQYFSVVNARRPDGGMTRQRIIAATTEFE